MFGYTFHQIIESNGNTILCSLNQNKTTILVIHPLKSENLNKHTHTRTAELHFIRIVH